MRTKRVAVVSLIAFCLGGVGGGAYAYVTHPINHGGGETSLTLNLEQAHENWEVEQFINEQEKLRPDGMEASKSRQAANIPASHIITGRPIRLRLPVRIRLYPKQTLLWKSSRMIIVAAC